MKRSWHRQIDGLFSRIRKSGRPGSGRRLGLGAGHRRRDNVSNIGDTTGLSLTPTMAGLVGSDTAAGLL